MSGDIRAAAVFEGGSNGTCCPLSGEIEGYKAKQGGTRILARNMDEESSKMGRNEGTRGLGEVGEDPSTLKIHEIGLEGEPGPYMSLEKDNTNISG